MAMIFPASPSTGTTFKNDNGSIYTYTAKGAWRLTSIGSRLLPASGVLTISPTSLNAMTANVAFSQTISASGGTGPYTFAVTGGVLPTSLSLNTSTGAITGTPSVAGVFNFEITATDSSGTPKTGKQSYTSTVAASGISISPTTLPAMTRWNAFSQTVTASGGTAPYTYTVTGGTALPAGLSLNASTGAITGSPTVSGPYVIQITATDSAGTPKTGSRTYTGTIAESAITLLPTSIGPLTKGQAISIALSETGGVAPFTYGTFSGSAPTGMSLNTSTGILSGTPTTVQTVTPVFKVTDTNSLVGARAYSIDVVAATTPVFYAGYSAPAPNIGFTGDFYYDNLSHILYRKTSSGWGSIGYPLASSGYYSGQWALNATGDIGAEVIYYADTMSIPAPYTNHPFNDAVGKPGDIQVVGNRIWFWRLGYGYWDTSSYYDMNYAPVAGQVPSLGAPDGGVHPVIYGKYDRNLLEWNGVSYSHVGGPGTSVVKSFTGDGSIYANPTAAGQTWGSTESVAIDLARPAVYQFTSNTAWNLIQDFH